MENKLNRRFFSPFRYLALALPGAAALLGIAALVLSGCPHSLGWSGEIPLGFQGEPLSWIEAMAHMNANPLQEGTVIYELDSSEEMSPPIPSLYHDAPSSANCPQRVVIEGNGKTVILTSTGTLLTVGPGVELTLRNITLKGVSNNSAPLILVDGGTVTLETAGIVRGNRNTHSPGYGGGVAVQGDGTFYLDGGEIRENLAYGYGGGVYVENGAAFLRGGSVYLNTAGSGGGVGIYRRASAFPRALVQLSGTTVIEGNTATDSGGGVYLQDYEADKTKLEMYGGSIRNNIALLGSGGGGVCVFNYGTFDMSGGEIRNNTAVNPGGGVSVSYQYTVAAFNMSGGTILENDSLDNGDGVYVGSEGEFSMSGSAAVAAGNPVYLDGYESAPPSGIFGAGASIKLTGVLTANPAAYIILADLLSGWPVLTGAVSEGSNYTRFSVEGGTINNSGVFQ
jgi:predicted outer membrane repeat protein